MLLWVWQGVPLALDRYLQTRLGMQPLMICGHCEVVDMYPQLYATHLLHAAALIAVWCTAFINERTSLLEAVCINDDNNLHCGVFIQEVTRLICRTMSFSLVGL